MINLDSQQDCERFAWKRRGNVTKFTFTRKFDTCDDHDYVIEVQFLEINNYSKNCSFGIQLY